MKRRQSILLLELLISLIIMGFVFEVLFLGYGQALAAKQKLYEEKEIVLGRQRLLLRLGTVFQTLQSCKQISDDWLLCYDGGMDPEIRFRGPLEALLCIRDHRLLLISWPGEGNPRIETLYENQELKTFSFSFFNAQTGGFQPSFPETKPIMMKMSLNLPLELPFFL